MPRSGFPNFWRRWHISLSSWLRDYLYISLRGNRGGSFKTYRNLILTMLLGGLWHGASWAFVVWGALHGLYLVLERLAAHLFGAWPGWKTLAGQIFLALVTFSLVCFAWIFFRAPDFDKAFEIIQAGLFLLPVRQVFVTNTEAITVVVLMAALMSVHWSLRNTTLEDAVARIPTAVRGGILGILLALIALSPGEDRAFIYFQF